MSQKNEQTHLKSLLKKYLRGESTVQENEAIDSWYHLLGTGTDSISPLESAERKQELNLEIKQFLNHHALGIKKRRREFQYIRYAAILLMIVAAGLVIRNTSVHHKKENKEVVFQSSDEAAKLVTLTDGSKVLLNVGSSLTIAKSFGDSIREVRLRGEAFFEIAKDAKHPFIVHSGDLKTSVLGTSFNINAYDDLDHIKIAVLTGKVRVSKNEQLLANGMTKGATLSFHKTTGKGTIKMEDAGYIAMWRDSKLNIENATLTEIARQLQRYYHIGVTFDKKLDNGKRYSIRFDREPANRVMEILSILTKRKFSYKTNQITIR